MDMTTASDGEVNGGPTMAASVLPRRESRRDQAVAPTYDRHGRGSTIITSQLAVEHWHEAIANPTIADAILDRLVHNAHRLNLKGESIRKTAAKRSQNSLGT